VPGGSTKAAPKLAVHLRRVALDAPHLMPESSRLSASVFLRSAGSRASCRRGARTSFHLYFFPKKPSTRESRERVRLMGERDILGMPRLKLVCSFGRNRPSHRSSSCIARCERAIAATGTAKLTYDESGPRGLDRRAFSHCNSDRLPDGNDHAWRPTRARRGGCAMPRHGMENLFIAVRLGIATSGHANPAFTLIALACASGRHLRGAR